MCVIVLSSIVSVSHFFSRPTPLRFAHPLTCVVLYHAENRCTCVRARPPRSKSLLNAHGTGKRRNTENRCVSVMSYEYEKRSKACIANGSEDEDPA